MAGGAVGSRAKVAHRAAPIPANKSKSREPVSVLLPAKQRSTKTTTTTDAQVFNVSWSATAVFTVSGEPLGSAFLHGNKTRIVPVSQPTASPVAAVTTPTASPHHHRQPDTRTRARGGGGSCPFRIPRTTSRSSRQRGRGNRLWRAGDPGASGSGNL
ncbi:hypothetical protein EDB84DRAFT_892532 [Lactarius hengduanensis]|nr:hypothetical protein EDB84DRAFT_892532 [Lactarius hengduanensis]